MTTIRQWMAFQLMRLAVWFDHNLVMRMAMALTKAEAQARMHAMGVEGIMQDEDGSLHIVHTEDTYTRH